MGWNGLIKRSIIVGGAGCLRAKSAAMLVYKTGEFMSEIYMSKGSRSANAKSLLGVLSLVIACSDTVEMTISGPDEEMAADLLEKFLMDMPE